MCAQDCLYDQDESPASAVWSHRTKVGVYRGVQDSLKALADKGGKADAAQAVPLQRALCSLQNLAHRPSPRQLLHLCSLLDRHASAVPVRRAPLAPRGLP